MIARAIVCAVFGFVAILATLVGTVAWSTGRVEVALLAGLVGVFSVVEIGDELELW